MSVIENAKETLKGLKELSEMEYALNKISKVMRLVAAIVLVSIYINGKLNLGIPFSTINFNLWNEEFRLGLKSYIYTVIIFWIIYELIRSKVLKWLCIKLDNTENTKTIPVLFTVNDFVDFVCSLYFLIYTVNRLIELNNTIVNEEEIVSFIAGAYLLIELISWSYIQNSNNWYRVNRDYTNYYDVNNTRIPANANVIYRGKVYRVYWSGDVVGLNTDSKKQEWRLSSRENHDSISLEEAANDREGNLTIETWEIRYKAKT